MGRDRRPQIQTRNASRHMIRQRAPIICLAGSAVIALCIVFVFLPDGWNILPLFLIALVLKGLSLQLKVIRRAPDAHTVDQPPAAAEREDRPVVATAEPSEDHTLPRRMNRAFGPIVAGMIIDLVDLATFGPVGLVLGLPVGGLAGYWMGRALGFDRRASLWCALAAGVYCTIPGTEFIPLATIMGACVRFQATGGRRNQSGHDE